MIKFNHLELKDFSPTHCDFLTNQNFILRIEAHAPGVYRLRCGTSEQLLDSHLNQRAQQRRDLLLARNEWVSEFELEHPLKNRWILTQGNTRLEVQAKPFKLAFFSADQCVLNSDSSYDFALVAQLTESDPAWALRLSLLDQLAVYGLGRTTGGYNRLGHELVSDLTAFDYSPLAWSPRGWGLYASSLGRVIHSIGSEDSTSYRLQIEDKSLDLFFFIGEVNDIFNQYSALTGRPGQPPMRAMGTWLRQTSLQSLHELQQVAQQLQAVGLSVDTLQLAQPSIFHFAADKLTMDLDESRLGDSRRFVTNQLKGSQHYCLPSFPGVPVGTPLFEELEDRGWLLNNEVSNRAHVFRSEFGEYGLLDLTYKDAYKLWQERHQQILDGSDAGFTIELPFEIPDGVSARHGETGAQLRQLYSMLLEGALFTASSYHKIPEEGLVMRTGISLNNQRTSWLKAKTSLKSYSDLGCLLREHLSVQASGAIVQVHELDSSIADEEFYLRALGLSIFCTNFILPAQPDQLPTHLSAGSQRIVYDFFQLRFRLVPYILGAIEDAVRTGLPVQRCMPLAFAQDSLAHQYECQYLFGPALLVAPILTKSDRVNVYLPAGEAWWDLNTSIRYEGGQVIDYQCDSSSVPVFGREGHMLCLGPALNSLQDFNSARILDEVWMFGMPMNNPVVMRNKIRVMQMQGSSYIKGLEGLKILQSEGLEVKRRGAEVRISRER